VIPASVIVRLATLGLTGAQADSVASMLSEVETATERKVGAELEARRASDRARKQKQRVMSRDITGHHVTSGTNGTGVSSRARVLPWEDSKSIPPDDPNGSSTPKGVAGPKKEKRVRATRLPEDWQPKAHHLELATSLGMGRDRYARLIDEFRDYWKATPGARGTKLDWDATFRNRIREIVQRERIVAPTSAMLALSSSNKVFVIRGTAQWAAWLKHLGKPSMPAIERNGEYGWNFETEWPPDATIPNSPPLPDPFEAGSSPRSATEREGEGREATEARFAHAR
jgi:hypothetical protein